jgi:excisionase family DNA binding protein
MSTTQDLLSASQAAKYLGITHQRLYQLAETGRLGRRIGTTWIFTRGELDQYKVERAQRPKGGRPKRDAGTPAVVNPA